MVSRAPQSNANNADASDRSLQASSALPRSTLPQGTVDGTSQPPPPQQQLLDSVFLAAPANDGSSLPSPSPQMSSTPASSPTSPSTCQLELQMNFKGGVPDQADTNKILRFYRVPGSRFKSVEELFAHHGYQIEGEKFAQGEYSQLFRARYTKTGILVACKQIDLAKTRPVLTSREMSRCESTTALAYIKNELHMLKILSEQPSPPPYIIKLYNHFVVNQNNASNTLYVFLKLAPEGSLAQYVHRCGPLTEPAAATIFSQLTVALEYLHLKGRIAHRDVKLEAVLLLSLPPRGDDPKLTGWSSTLVMLTNFGASRTVTTGASLKTEQGQGQQQGLCHTACAGVAGQYTPPELLDEKVLATTGYNPFLVDVWMAGITLYGMVCYPAFPFPQEDTQAQLRAQCSRAWRWPPTVKPSPPLHALLWAMLQPDPAARIRVEALARQQWLAAEYKTAARRSQQPQPQPQPQQAQQKQQSQQQHQPQQQAQPKQQQQPKQSPLLPKPAQEVSSKKLKSIEKSKISGKIKSSSSKGAKSGKKKSINSGSGSSRNKSSKAKSSTSKSKRSAPTQVVKSIVASKRSSKSAAPKSTTKSKSSSSAAFSKSNKKTTKSLGKTTSSSAKSNKK